MNKSELIVMNTGNYNGMDISDILLELSVNKFPGTIIVETDGKALNNGDYTNTDTIFEYYLTHTVGIITDCRYEEGNIIATIIWNIDDYEDMKKCNWMVDYNGHIFTRIYAIEVTRN